MFAAIWIALALFAVGELGKRRLYERSTAPGWMWAASVVGLGLGCVHVYLAIAGNNDWNHAIAWRVTEDRMREMFGFGWGGAVAGNYAFLAVWAIELWQWRRNPAAFGRRSALMRWGLNAFFAGILIPATIVFAAGERRVLGFVLMIPLLWAWRPVRS